MARSPEELQAFKGACRNAFGEKLDDVEAAGLAYRLEELYRLILTKPEAPAPKTLMGLSDSQL